MHEANEIRPYRSISTIGMKNTTTESLIDAIKSCMRNYDL